MMAVELKAFREKRQIAAAFTMVEVLVASAIAFTILAGAMVFFNFTAVSVSGITAQSTLNDQAANAIQFLQERARLATSASNDATGSILTLGFDDDYAVDSNKDTVPYNDVDHLERFQVIGSSTNALTSTNSLVYLGTNGTKKILITTGVCKLPGKHYFFVTNTATVRARFAVVDSYARDRYQSIDIQSTIVLLNRRSSTNYIAILP